jgi:hypothetical protein
VRPVKSSQVWLKNVHSESVRDIHSSTGEASAMLRNRCSVSDSCCSVTRRRVVSQITATAPTISPSARSGA